MKNYLFKTLTLALLSVFLLTACSKKDKTKPETPPEVKKDTVVYVLGVSFSDWVIQYWRGNQTTVLEDALFDYEFADPTIKVLNGDVYIAGALVKSLDYSSQVPTFWKNGKPQTIVNDTGTVATDLGVDTEGNIYICGVKDTDGTAELVVWKNGEEILSGKSCRWISGIEVVDKDVYVIGSDEDGSLAYWKNGDKTIVYTDPSSSFSGELGSIAVKDGEVHIVGYIRESGEEPSVYWKNGSQEIVNDTGYFSAIAFKGDDLYMVGGMENDESYRAALWKNGEFQVLPGGDAAGAAAIAIDQDYIYVAGNEGQPFGGDLVAQYWKNGKLISLKGSQGWSAVDIFIAHE